MEPDYRGRWIERYAIYRTIRGHRWTHTSKPVHGKDTYGLWIFVFTVCELFWWFWLYVCRGTPLTIFVWYMMILTAIICTAGIRLAYKGRQ